jgi:hypothetical protein
VDGDRVGAHPQHATEPVSQGLDALDARRDLVLAPEPTEQLALLVKLGHERPRAGVVRVPPGLGQPARMVFMYTPGGPENLFVEGGDEPHPGVQVQPWGPERLDEHLMSLLAKYDTALPPEPTIG